MRQDLQPGYRMRPANLDDIAAVVAAGRACHLADIGELERLSQASIASRRNSVNSSRNSMPWSQYAQNLPRPCASPTSDERGTSDQIPAAWEGLMNET